MPGHQPANRPPQEFWLKLILASFLGLVLIFYFFNLSNVFRFNSQESAARNHFDWDQLRSDFSATIDQVNQDFQKANQERVVKAAEPLVNQMVSDINQQAAAGIIMDNLEASQTPAVLTATDTVSTVIPTANPINQLENNLQLNKK